MKEQDIIFKSGEIELAGSIAFPDSAGPHPAVLLIAGSGKLDRNENNPKLRLNILYEISRYLAENGIASLRYDKRGVGLSQGDYMMSGVSDNVLDARAALDFLKQQKNIESKKIFLLGHSEGAFISVNMAGSKADVAGIVLLAGGAQSGEAVLKWQASEIAKGMKGIYGWIIRTFHIDICKAQQKQMDKIKTSKKDCVRIQPLVKINAKWFREFMDYDPAVDLRRITVPVLAITGSKDFQVDPNDLVLMQKMVKAPFESRLIDGMTHMLRVEEGKADISMYKEEIKRPVEQKVLEEVTAWIKKQIL
jgi:uncharacterized protein